MGIQCSSEEWSCRCGRCGTIAGPYSTEARLKDIINNWSYVWHKNVGDTLCQDCVKEGFEALLDIGDSGLVYTLKAQG